MATNLLQQSVRANDPDFQARIRSQIARHIPNVMNEAASVKGHPKRIALMHAICSPGGMERYIAIFAAAIAGEAPIIAVDNTALITDAQINTALSNVFGPIAGVEILDP